MTRNINRVSTVAAAVAVALLAGCSKAPEKSADPALETQSESQTETQTQPDDGLARHSYTVRGKVVTIPSAERPMDDLQIKHEAIPDFKNREGIVFENSKGVKGMMSMTMGFPLAEGVTLGDITPGDLIEFTFVTTWGEKYPSYEVTKVIKLPADTKLNFGN